MQKSIEDLVKFGKTYTVKRGKFRGKVLSDGRCTTHLAHRHSWHTATRMRDEAASDDKRMTLSYRLESPRGAGALLHDT